MRNAVAAACLIMFGAFALASCETMSAEECAVADWRGVGYGDGASGQNRFSARQESCAKKGFAADLDAYRAGHQEGLRVYCTPPRGFQRGLSGSDYDGFCPADLDELFSVAFADGRRVHEVRVPLEAARSEHNRLENRRDQIDRDIPRKEEELRVATTDDDRRRLREEIRSLNDERRRVNDDLRTKQSELRWRGAEEERLRYEIGDRWGPW
ncbi:MAG: DUF2799 domain-containing protein [Hyphomonadaceae bacterium]|nr:DUF2799 domain-containing protein [Hyphomonadaceae bacterium]